MIKNVWIISITKTRLFKYIENFTTKNWKFSDKNSDIPHISAQNIDCWHIPSDFDAYSDALEC